MFLKIFYASYDHVQKIWKVGRTTHKSKDIDKKQFTLRKTQFKHSSLFHPCFLLCVSLKQLPPKKSLGKSRTGSSCLTTDFASVELSLCSSLHLKKRHPNPALLGGGVNTFSNKKGLVRRMTMIQSALDRYDLGQHFTYS